MASIHCTCGFTAEDEDPTVIEQLIKLHDCPSVPTPSRWQLLIDGVFSIPGVAIAFIVASLICVLVTGKNF